MMHRIARVVLIITIAAGMVGGTSSNNAAPKGNGQGDRKLVLTIHELSSSTVRENWMYDNVTATVDETVVYLIKDYDGLASYVLELLSHHANHSVVGGGWIKGSRSWVYRTYSTPESQFNGMSISFREGYVQVGCPNNPCSWVKASSGHLEFANSAANNYPHYDQRPDFERQLRRTFKPNAKNISVHGHASVSRNDNGTQLSREVDYSVVTEGEQEAEAEIIPSSAYFSWVPEAGEDEQKPGNTITVQARIYKKGDPTKPSGKNARFQFQLVDVSKEKGVCLNWPEASDSTAGFDLKIEPKSNKSLKVAGDGQSAESAAGLSGSTVAITSHDWGAYGKLRVTVDFDDGSTADAHVRGYSSTYELTLPRDENGNHIADFWETLYPIGSLDAKADDDLYPAGDNSLGDGLSLYEEYRGFRVQRKHLRTNPTGKDLFIRDNDNLYPTARGYFVQSGLIVHLLREEECGLEDGATNPWVINLNRGFATRGQQHLLRMKNEDLPGLYGVAAGTGPGTPKTARMVKINVASCLETSAHELKTTIAHELAHGCNVSHHGTGDYNIEVYDHLMPDGMWYKFTPKNEWHVSVQGGQESGVEECIMRYESANLRETPTGTYRFWPAPDRVKLGELYTPWEEPGTIFCETQGGTGVNDERRPGGSKAGDATKGNCRGQFCVNDNKN
jgi:hypothetical protein